MNELPAGWAETMLGDVATIVSGSTPKTGVPGYWGGEVRWITPDDLSKNRQKMISAGARSLTSAGYDSCSTTLMPLGSVLYSSRAPIGYVAIAGGPVCTNQGFKSFVPSGALISDYLYWFLTYATPAIRKLGSGTTFPELSKKSAASVVIPLPPLNEQHRIVAAIEEQFSRLDAAEVSLGHALALTDAMRRSLLNAVFGSVGQHRPLGDLAQTQLGKMLSEKSKTGVGGRPYLRNKNIQWGRIELDDVLVMDFSERDVEKFALAPGDVLVCEGGEVGRAAIWRGGLDGCCYQKALHRVRVGDALLPDYLVHVMRWLAEGNGFDPYVTGSTIRHLPQEDLRLVPIPAPKVEEQARIVARLEQQLTVVLAMNDAIEKAHRRSAALRRSVLERGFRGELVAHDPSDEPASELLERIRDERASAPPQRRRRRVSV